MRHSPAIKLTLALAAAAGLAAAAFAANRPPSGAARLLSAYEWTGSQRWFGGFSAIELGPGGTSMTVLSDRSTLVTARIERQGGQITGVTQIKAHKLLGSTGKTLRGRPGDSEGLAVTPDGALYISYEGVPRVALHRRPDAPSRVLPRPGVFRKLPLNGAFEALAADAQGRLYTLPEAATDRNGDIPVWRWDGAAWSLPFSLPRRGGFRPVGADFGPGGRFYLLERDFALLGFRSRLRRWDITPEGAVNETTLLQTAWGTHDNLEGLAVWETAGGGLRATMVSDDNFQPLQRTELVDYALPR